jgi:dTMP kinase
MNNVFVVIEGLDGVGKSSVAQGLAAKMTEGGFHSTSLRCPMGDYKLSEPYVRHECGTDARYLFYLSGVKHSSDIIRNLLTKQSVVLDRYYYSTLAYHRACGMRVTVDIDSMDLLQPNFRYLLTVADERVRQARLKSRKEVNPSDQVARVSGGLIDRIESEFKTFGLIEIDTTELRLNEVVQLLWEKVSEGKK